jgi:hypothetical protein
VDATTGAICELGEYLAGERIEKVTLESTAVLAPLLLDTRTHAVTRNAGS